LFEKKYGEKIDFLATINLFQHWSITQISALLFNMEEHTYQRKQIIFKEGQGSQNIHFVLNGEVEVENFFQFFFKNSP
jgi:CRP-like cAMP-binding protein